VKRLLLATTNPGKQGELRRLLSGISAELVVPGDLGLALDVPEPYVSYAENAAAKAVAWCRASGLLTVADDSGIEVAALAGGPGPRSARYGAEAGVDGATYLLERLAGATDRAARMVCVVALGVPDGPERRVETFSGTVDGSVAAERRGAGGFGYDPIFLMPDGRTTAELADEEKDRISHRGRAVRAAIPRLRELLANG
jgi:XTP/dITP diphosphohydrolase